MHRSRVVVRRSPEQQPFGADLVSPSRSARPARTRSRTSRHPAGSYSGCTASSDSSTAGRGRPARSASAPWPNFVAAGGRSDRARRRDMRDLAEREEHPHFRQRSQRRLEVVAAGRDFARLRLVRGRQAFDCVEDHRALELQPVVGIGAYSPSASPNLSSVA